MSELELYEYDYFEKAKIKARDVRVGMFVCELDRPWLETPFQLQGFEVKNAEEIGLLRQYCQHVYIDVLRTRVERMQIDAPPPGTFPAGDQATPFREEVRAAGGVTAETTNLIQEFAEQIHYGTSIDIQMAREAVSSCVASVTRNPQAMLFMARMQEKSDSLSQHALNTCVYAVIVGRALGLDGKELEALGTAALLHDLGKVSVPDEVLNKPTPLDVREFALIKQHAKLGREILLSGRQIDDNTVNVAYTHHERLDGSGYPQGLREPDLQPHSRIVAAVEKYEAILSPRPYRPPYNHLDAMNILNRMVKRRYLDGEVVEVFLAYLGIYPPGSLVELSNGEKAIVLETRPAQRLRPLILVVRDRDSNPAARFVDMALKPADDRQQPYRIKGIHPPGSFGVNLLDYRGVVMKALG